MYLKNLIKSNLIDILKECNTLVIVIRYNFNFTDNFYFYVLGFDKDLNVDILEMPYNGNVYNVIILLPRNESRTVIAQLLTSLSRQKLNDIIVKKSNVKKTNVKIEIPKFKVEKTYDLVKVLKYI